MFARTMIAFGLLFASGVAANAELHLVHRADSNVRVHSGEAIQKLAHFNIGGERLGRLCAKILFAKLEKHRHSEFFQRHSETV